jgi:hypothetical protein
MPNPTITLSPRGAARREVLLTDIQIPDMWHLASVLSQLDQHCKHIRKCPIAPINRDGWFKRDAQMILETWHLAYDLLDHLKVQHGLEPAPKSPSEPHRTLWERLSDD